MTIEPNSRARKIAFNIADKDDIEVGHKTIGIDVGLAEIVELVIKELESDEKPLDGDTPNDISYNRGKI